jgi:hypothetical protein
VNQAKNQANLCAAGCGRPVADTGYLCHSDNNSCTAIMSSNLEFLARGAADIDITITRRDRLTPRSSAGRSAETALPFNDTAATNKAELNAALVRLARDIAKRRGFLNAHTDPPLVHLIAARPGTSAETAAAARYITAHLRWARAQGALVDGEPFAAAAYTTVQDAARLLARTIGPHPDMADYGPCGAEGCDGKLVAPAAAREVRCECGSVYSTAAIRDMQMEWVSDRLFTTAELAVLLSRRHCRRVPDGTIASWGTRGDIAAHGKTPSGAALYRLDEATERCDRYIAEADAKKAAIAAKREANRKEAQPA